MIKKSKGAQIRSNIKWIEKGETNSKYFLSLEKRNQSSNNIKEIKTKDGLKINKANAILGEMYRTRILLNTIFQLI